MRSGAKSSFAYIKVPRWLYLLWIFSLALIVTQVYILYRLEQSSGYESNIYLSVPEIFWILLALSTVGGILAALIPALEARKSVARYWMIGVFLVAMNTAVILLLPVMRGYAGYGRSDILIHAGRALDIVSLGHLPVYDRPSSGVIYPTPMYLLAFVATMIDVDPFQVVQYIPFATFLTLFLFNYMVSRDVLSNPFSLAISMLSSCIIFFSSINYEVWPTLLGFTNVVFVLWLFLRVLRDNSLGYRMLLIAASLSTVFIHPVVCISLILGLSVVEMYRLGSSWREKHTARQVINTVVILLVSFVTWLTMNYFFWSMTVNELANVISALGEGGAAQAFNQLDSINVSLMNSIVLLIRMSGHAFFYIALVFVAGIWIFRTRKTDPQSRQILPLAVYAFSQVGMFIIVLFCGSGAVSYWRSLAAIILISPPIVGYLGGMVMKYYLFRIRRNIRPGRIISVTAAAGSLFLAYAIGMFGYFPSPETYRVNQQISSAELAGMAWLADQREDDIPVDSITIKFAFVSALKGYRIIDETPTVNAQKWGETLNFPDHFDYSAERKPSERFPLYYLPISAYDRAYETLIQRNPVTVLPEDLLRISHETNFGKIYTNGDLDVWLVRREEPR